MQRQKQRLVTVKTIIKLFQQLSPRLPAANTNTPIQPAPVGPAQ